MKLENFFLFLIVTILLIIALPSFTTFLDERNRRACAHVDPEAKTIASVILRYQREHHENNSEFIASYNSFAEIDPDLHEYFMEDKMFQRWNVAIKSYENYGMVRVYPKLQAPGLRAYTGVTIFDASEEGYRRFMCSSTKIDRPLELQPIETAQGRLVFECPPKSREDC